MLVNTELLDFIRIKNPLSSAISKYTEIKKTAVNAHFAIARLMP